MILKFVVWYDSQLMIKFVIWIYDFKLWWVKVFVKLVVRIAILITFKNLTFCLWAIWVVLSVSARFTLHETTSANACYNCQDWAYNNDDAVKRVSKGIYKSFERDDLLAFYPIFEGILGLGLAKSMYINYDGPINRNLELVTILNLFIIFY